MYKYSGDLINWLKRSISAKGAIILIVVYLTTSFINGFTWAGIYAYLDPNFLREAGEGTALREIISEINLLALLLMTFILAFAEELLFRFPLYYAVNKTTWLSKFVLGFLALSFLALSFWLGVPYAALPYAVLLAYLSSDVSPQRDPREILVITFFMSFIFGYIHFGFYSLPIQGIGGILLSLVFLKSGVYEGKILKPLLWSTTAHFLHNAILMFLIIFASM